MLIASALHAGALVAGRWMAAPPISLGVPFSADAEIEVSLAADDAAAISSASAVATPATALGSPRARPPAAREAQRVAVLTAPHDSDGAEAAGTASDGAASPPSAEGQARRPLDLGLNGGVRRAALLGGWVDVPALPRQPSDGGLRQGLAALDAERGLSRSSPAQHAAYTAARRFAPSTGMGTFDVVTDARGSVLSVTLTSVSTDEAQWQRVGQELRQLLEQRRLRVPPGAKGLVARLRVETGELAQDVAERFRTRRGAALGQAPMHPREVRAESTRSSLEPGQLSPTLGISLAGGGSNARIRVVLLDERPL